MFIKKILRKSTGFNVSFSKERLFQFYFSEAYRIVDKQYFVVVENVYANVEKRDGDENPNFIYAFVENSLSLLQHRVCAFRTLF